MTLLVAEGLDKSYGRVRALSHFGLGAYPCQLDEGSVANRIYGSSAISERHRHRFEVNPTYHQALIEGGLRISGWSPDRVLAEIVELQEHPWFVGCQFHPEFKSRPLEPHPLFASYIRAVAEQKRVRGDRGLAATLA